MLIPWLQFGSQYLVIAFHSTSHSASTTFDAGCRWYTVYSRPKKKFMYSVTRGSLQGLLVLHMFCHSSAVGIY